MANSKIHYAIIALIKNEAKEVVDELKKQGRKDLANWLESNMDRVYGDEPEKWKPFNGQEIEKLINNSGYYSEQHLISEVFINSEILPELVKSVEVYFIDLFSLFLKKYKELARDMDLTLGSTDKGKCCFLINYGLSIEIQDELEKEMCKAWRYVYKAYQGGSLHRIAVRVDDLKNFRNYLLKISKDRPSNVAMQALDENGWEQKPLSRLGEN